MGKEQSKNQCSMKADNDDFVTVNTYQGETKDGKRHGRGVFISEWRHV